MADRNGIAMLNDKALRAKFVYLAMADAMATLRGRPSRAELEAEISAISERNGMTLVVPADEHFIRPGNVLGHITTMAHNCIYHFELGDYRERKTQAAQEATGQRNRS